jgi:alcohol dehydrogenase class IV
MAAASGGNLEAIGNMLLASTITGIAFTNTSLGLVHAMSHPVSAHFGVPHGITNAILLPEVMRFNWIADPPKFAAVAALLGDAGVGDTIEKARRAADAVATLARAVNIPWGLREAGVPVDAADMLAQEAIQESFIQTNPRSVSVPDIAAIYRKAI